MKQTLTTLGAAIKKPVLLALCQLAAIAAICQPTITAVTPLVGYPASSVTITGTGFNTTLASNVVYFGAVKASISSASATSLVVTVPVSATYMSVSVDNLSTHLTAYSDYPFLPDYNNSTYVRSAANFNANIDFAADNQPFSVAIGDIDGDGKPDLVVADNGSNTISVYRNTSTAGTITAGSFAAKVDFATGTSPTSVAIGDIDGDGKPDLVMANSGGVSVYHNTSSSGAITTASFAAQVTFATGTNPQSVAIGDIDGDGKADLVVANYGSNTVSVLHNTSTSGSITTASFAAQVAFATGTNPNSVAIGDVDGDGKQDLAVANSGSNSVCVLHNTSTRGAITTSSFAARVTFATDVAPDGVAIGDLDGDGKPDLAVANYGSDSVSVLHNTGSVGSVTTGSFAAPVGFATGSNPFCVAIGDINGDGKPDLVVANYGGSTVSVFLNTGSVGSITTASFAGQVVIGTETVGTESEPRSVAIGDIDGDGKPDLVIANSASYDVSVIRNNPLTAPPPSPTITSLSPSAGYPTSSVTITGTDFNTTAANDIVFFGATRAAVSSASATSLVVTVPASATYMPVSVDNLGINLTAYSDYPFLPDYNNSAYTPSIVNFNPQTNFTTGNGPISAAIGDLDGDGKPDLVVVNNSDNTISVYHNTSASGSITAGSFAAAVDFATGSGPQSIAIGDIDGDGKPDLVVVNTTGGSISVFRNTSSTGSITTGSFAAQVTFSGGSLGGGTSVAIGDIDGDGKPDLLVGEESSYVTVFRNTGSVGSITAGSFSAGVAFAAGNGPVGVAIGDIDGDGKPDLVVANNLDNTVSVLHNIGSAGAITAASFTAAVNFATATTPYSVAVGDIDGDGKPDLAVTNYGSGSVSVFHNTGSVGSVTTGSFAAAVSFATGSSPISVAMGDINGDGKPDLVVANQGSNTVSVLRNTGSAGAITTGSFAAQVTLATGTTTDGVAIGDIDGDGKPDVVAVNLTSNTISVIMNNPLPAPAPSPSITAISPLVGYPASSVTITGTDFNTTAANNIVFFGATQASVTSASATSLVVTVPAGATYMPVSVDNLGINLTGYSDYPFLPDYNNSAYIPGTVNFNPQTSFAAATGPFSIAIADIDGDGKPDLVVANDEGSVSVYHNTSSTGTITAGSFAAAVNFTTGVQPRNIAIGDIDGDGKPDIVVSNNGSNTISVLRNTSSAGSITTGSFAAQVTFATGANPQGVAIGDVDGDGKPDLVVANNTDGTISVFRNTGSAGAITSGSFAAQVVFATIGVPAGVAIADVNGDGKADLVVANSANSSVSALQNTGSAGVITPGSFAPQVTFAAGLAPNGIAISDIDGDGKPDIIVANQGSNTVSVLRNTGSSALITTGSFAAQVTFATGTDPYSVAIGDIDGDGKPDLVVANDGSNNVSVLRNTSSAGSITTSSFAAQVAFATGSGPECIAIGDIDGDGKPDLAVTNFGANTISVIRNNPLLPITGTTILCAGSTITVSDATSGGAWASGNTAIATVGSATGIVTGIATGTVTITYAVTGGQATTVVTVNLLPPAPITGAQNVCAGATTALADATTGGVWSSNTTATATAGSAMGVITGVAAGTATISYTVSNTCGSASATAIVTVNAVPVAITGTHNACPAGTSGLADATTGGYWTSSSTAIATVGSSTGTVTGVTAGTAVITYTLATGCATTRMYTVNPDPAAIGASTPVCTGATIILTDATTGGTWVSGNTTIATTGSATGIISGVAAGNSTIVYKLSTGCSISAPVTVNASPAAITGTLDACAAATTTLADATTGGHWTSGTTTIAIVGSSTGTVTGVATGTSVITYTSAIGCAATKIYTVNASPTAIVGATTAVCSGTTITLTDGITGGTWTSGTTTIATTGSATGIAGGVTAGTSIITYKLSSGCSVTAHVTVNASPAAITGTLDACAAATTTLADATTGGHWTSGTTTIATVGSSTGTVTGVAIGTSVITYTSAAGCAATKIYTVNASPTAIVGATTAVCAGTTITLTDGVTGGTWASGTTTIATTGSATGIVGGVTAGTSIITYKLSSGCSATAHVTVNASPAAITGTLDACAAATTTLADATTGGHWTSGTTTIAIVGSSTGTVTGVATGTSLITYALTTGCTATKVYTVNASPTAISANIAICAGATITLTDAITGGTWASGSTTIATAGSATGIVGGVAAGTSTITYKLSSGCSVTAPVTVHASPAAITGTASVAVAATTSLVDGTTGGTWSSASTTIATIGSAGIVTGVAIGSATISYTLSDGCAKADVVTVTAAAGRAGNDAGTANSGSAISDIRVIPNPNNGAFTIKGTLGTTKDEGVTIQIVNMLGQVIYTTSVITQNGEIDQPVQLNGNIANGMYILNLSSGDQKNAFHIVVEQ